MKTHRAAKAVSLPRSTVMDRSPLQHRLPPVQWYSFHQPQKNDRLSQPHLVLIQQSAGAQIQDPKLPKAKLTPSNSVIYIKSSEISEYCTLFYHWPWLIKWWAESSLTMPSEYSFVLVKDIPVCLCSESWQIGHLFLKNTTWREMTPQGI